MLEDAAIRSPLSSVNPETLISAALGRHSVEVESIIRTAFLRHSGHLPAHRSICKKVLCSVLCWSLRENKFYPDERLKLLMGDVDASQRAPLYGEVNQFISQQPDFKNLRISKSNLVEFWIWVFLLGLEGDTHDRNELLSFLEYVKAPQKRNKLSERFADFDEIVKHYHEQGVIELLKKGEKTERFLKRENALTRIVFPPAWHIPKAKPKILTRKLSSKKSVK